MMTRRTLLGVIAAGCSAGLSGCGLFVDYRYRCRMTVEVATPEGLKRGSSVFEVRTMPGTDLMTGGTVSESVVRGEAVVVDLPGDRALFALLKTVNDAGHDNLAHMSMRTLDPAFAYDRVQSAKRLRSRSEVRLSGNVPVTDHPILVTFDDLDDPMTVRLVDPNDLAASFGDGVRLVAVLAELTNNSVTTGLQGRLPWVRDDAPSNLDNDFMPTTTPTLAQKLKHADFLKTALKQA